MLIKTDYPYIPDIWFLQVFEVLVDGGRTSLLQVASTELRIRIRVLYIGSMVLRLGSSLEYDAFVRSELGDLTFVNGDLKIVSKKTPVFLHACATISEVHLIYWVTQKLPQIYTANHATFPIRMRKITVQICGNFWVTQLINLNVLLSFALICEICTKQLICNLLLFLPLTTKILNVLYLLFRNVDQVTQLLQLSRHFYSPFPLQSMNWKFCLFLFVF